MILTGDEPNPASHYFAPQAVLLPVNPHHLAILDFHQLPVPGRQPPVSLLIRIQKGDHPTGQLFDDVKCGEFSATEYVDLVFDSRPKNVGRGCVECPAGERSCQRRPKASTPQLHNCTINTSPK